MDLVYIGKRLKDALRLEDVLTKAGIDYAVEVEQYIGGFIFKRQRAGAFFYVLPEVLDHTRSAMSASGFEIYSGSSSSG